MTEKEELTREENTSCKKKLFTRKNIKILGNE